MFDKTRINQAVSPVIGTMLLVVITIGVASAVYLSAGAIVDSYTPEEQSYATIVMKDNPDTVTFQHYGGKTIPSYTIRIGDGQEYTYTSLSIGQEITIPKNWVASKTITLTTSDGAILFYAVVTNHNNIPPVASWTYTPLLPNNIVPTVFQCSSTDKDGTIESWLWSFGDSNTSTQKNPSHTYTTPGVYTVSLIVTDNKGGTATHTQQITITNNPPTASNFTVTLANNFNWQTFNATTLSGATDPEGQPVTLHAIQPNAHDAGLPFTVEAEIIPGTQNIRVQITNTPGNQYNVLKTNWLWLDITDGYNPPERIYITVHKPAA